MLMSIQIGIAGHLKIFHTRQKTTRSFRPNQGRIFFRPLQYRQNADKVRPLSSGLRRQPHYCFALAGAGRKRKMRPPAAAPDAGVQSGSVEAEMAYGSVKESLYG